ncbi:MAG: VanZ family protein [Oscillospiraceae bacterium]|nr:VanZ family protein [Oscillospiraceae bacterium]
MKSKKKVIYISIFCVYMLFLLIVVIFKILPHFQEFIGQWNSRRYALQSGQREINWVLNPFRTIIEFHSIGNICKNVLSFIPFGFYVFRFFRSSFFKTILASELFILVVQVIRFASLIGFFDTADFIRYTVGILIGIVFAKLYDSKLINIKFNKKAVN